MPRIGFKCPDGQEVKFEDCLKECKMKQRCTALPVLESLSKDRPFNNKISATTGLHGTRETILKKYNDYYIDPVMQGFILIGNGVHYILEHSKNDNIPRIEWRELFMENEFMCGTADYIFIEPKTGTVTLIDYKTAGAFKVKKALGLEYELVETEELYKRSSKKEEWSDRLNVLYKKIKDTDFVTETEELKDIMSILKKEISDKKHKKDEPKFKKVWKSNPDKADNYEYAVQANAYRVLFEETYGLPVKNLQICLFARDFSQQSASMGIEQQIYLVDLPIIPNEKILAHYKAKYTELKECIDNDVIPPLCSNTETWDGLKCKKYCEVSDICKRIQEKENE